MVCLVGTFRPVVIAVSQFNGDQLCCRSCYVLAIHRSSSFWFRPAGGFQGPSIWQRPAANGVELSVQGITPAIAGISALSADTSAQSVYLRCDLRGRQNSHCQSRRFGGRRPAPDVSLNHDRGNRGETGRSSSFRKTGRLTVLGTTVSGTSVAGECLMNGFRKLA